MAVTGQFGKAITGSGSLASAVQGIASDYMNLRMDRIYNAFINKTVFEGREMTATLANDLLNQMLKNVQKGGKMEMDIQDMTRAIRKAQRVRTLNDLDGALADKGASGDYANKVRTIREMLLDPRLNPDEITALKKELETATKQMMDAAVTQYDERGKITVNGKEIDLSAAGAKDQIIALYDAAITASPDTADKLAQQKAEALANMAISDANHAWSDKTLTTDSQKLAARKEQVKIIEAALAAIKRTPYAGSERAQALSDALQTFTDQVKVLGDNIATEAAGKKYAGASDKIFGTMDALDKEISKLSSIATLMTSQDGKKYSLAGIVATNPNLASFIIEEYARQTGKSSIVINGQSIDLSVDGLYNLSMDTKADAKSLYLWSKNSPFLTEGAKADIKSMYDLSVELIANAPNLRMEDKYDTITETLTSALEKASANIGDRTLALKTAGNALLALAKMDGIGPSERAQLENEARLYLGGNNYDAVLGTYGNASGNFRDGSAAADYLGSLIFGDLSGNADLMNPGIVDAVSKIYGDQSEWENDNGVIYTDAYGNVKATTRGAAAPSFENGAGMEVTTVTEHDYNGTKILKETANVVQRIRIMFAGSGSNTSKLDQNTVGWVAQLPNGEWVVTAQDVAGAQRVLNAADSQAFMAKFFPNGVTMKIIGGQQVTTLSQVDGNALRGSSGTLINQNDLLNGSLMTVLSSNGYTLGTNNSKAIQDSIDAAIRSGKLKIINGRAIIVGGIRGRDNIDITDRLGATGLAWVTANMEAMGKPGYGVPTFPTGAGASGPMTPEDAAQSDNPYVRNYGPSVLAGAKPPVPGTGVGAGSSAPPVAGKKDLGRDAWWQDTKTTPQRNAVAGPQASNIAIGKAGFASKAEAIDAGAMSNGLLKGFMRNMPTATGASIGTGIASATQTPTKRTFKDIERRAL